MMTPGVLAYHCQMHLLSPPGIIKGEADWCALELPGNPRWHWGNFMVWMDAPCEGDLQAWEAEWDRQFPSLGHRSFCWDRADGYEGSVEAFVAAGYTRFDSRTCVLQRNIIHVDSEYPIRFASDDNDWQQVLQLQRLVDTEKYTGGAGDYKQAQINTYRELVHQNRGQWLCAFDENGKLVGDLGVFKAGAGRAMLQLVETHPDFRRKGICTALTAKAAAFAFSQPDVKELVVVAQAHHPAATLYEKMGFAEREQTVEVSVKKEN